MSLLTRLLSLFSAGSMLISGALNTAAPQHDPSGTLFLVNRQWRVTEAFEPGSLDISDVPGQVRKLRPDAAAALREMFQTCKEETGVQLISVSAIFESAFLPVTLGKYFSSDIFESCG